jgi:hypothetical protein
MDNDGDLDCIVTNDGGQTARSYYYANNGNGTFSGTTLTSRGTRIGCSLVDCNGDGALDALMVGYIHTNKILYQNVSTNGNNDRGRGDWMHNNSVYLLPNGYILIAWAKDNGPNAPAWSTEVCKRVITALHHNI